MDMKLGIALGRFRKPSLGALPVVLNQPTTLQVTEVSGGRKLTWTNNSEYHAGTYVYRAPTLDPLNLPAPVATVDPVAQGETAEWIDNDMLADGSHEYAVRDFDGEGVGILSTVQTYTAGPDYTAAVIGDLIGGGVLAGTKTIGGIDYYIIFGLQSSEVYGINQKTTADATAGTSDPDDGLANTESMIAAGITNHPAGNHCVNYVDAEGNDDYYLPAMNELALEANLRGHAQLSTATADFRWSSTQSDLYSNRARDIKFTDGTVAYTNKTYGSNRRTRPVRRVPV